MSKIKETKDKPMIVALSAVDPYIATNIVEPTEKEVHGYDFIECGQNNRYPSYLLTLFEKTPVLHSLIIGCADYTCGDDAILSNEPFNLKVNDKDETVNDLLKQIMLDYWTFGSFAINIVRNIKGGIACLYYIPVKNLRTNKKCDRFWYAEDWEKSYGRVKAIEYPKFDINGQEPSSIYYYKNNYNTVYGVPVYAPATIAAEILKNVDEYHLNSINNGFFASYILSFNNGQPSPDVAQEIEDEVNEKFSGYQNAGRIMISFSKSKDSAPTVEKLEQDNSTERYESLVKWSQGQLFTAFRAAPMLFGIMQENNGFSDEDFSEAYKLFSRTMIRPTQRMVCDCFKKIFGENVLTIKPFTLDWDNEQTETAVN